MADRPDFWSFGLAFRHELFAAMSGGASIPFVVAAVYVDNKYGQTILALCALTCAWFAAFRLWRPERNKVCDYEERLSPKVNVYLDPDCAGIRVAQTRIGDNRGPDSKWIQLIVESATDAPLVDCEARLIKVEQLNADAPAAAILTEPVFCTWSNMPVNENRCMTIPAGVPQAANLFSASEGLTELFIQTVPIKYEFRDAMQKKGTYRLKVGVSARDCLTNVQTFLFKWGASYDDIGIIQER